MKALTGSIYRLISSIYILAVLSQTVAYNVDVHHPVMFEDRSSESSHFGFSVGLVTNNDGSWVIVGAPKANSSEDNTEVIEPGAIFKCSISTQHCEELPLQNSIPTQDDDYTFGYEQNRNNSFLGGSLDISQNSNPTVVACGHLWRNMKLGHSWSCNGVCYAFDSKLQTKDTNGLIPLGNLFKQTDGGATYVYEVGMAGFSSHFIQNSSDLVLGAPGVVNFKGTVVYSSEQEYKYPRPHQTFHIPIPSDTPADDSYLGYSISSGKFFKGEGLNLVAGAPRDGLSGSVYILEKPLAEDKSEFRFYLKLEGNQMGEYFGGSVCAVDFNGDGFCDLLVGAPLHSNPNLEVQWDEGKVYVYKNNGIGGLLSSNEDLIGNVPGGRFGSSIASIGDLDRDGFQDIAIGAPYEDAGAIYIYRGGLNGLTLAQKIQASEFQTKIRGFGISISKGKDIDENAYIDLAVGAYDSAHAVLLRSYPIVSLQSTLDFSVSHITLGNASCSFENNKTVCFSAQICLTYYGNDVPDEISIITTLDVDKNIEGEPRAFVEFEGKALNSIREKADLVKHKQDCKTYEVHLLNKTFDIFNPINFNFKSELSRNPRGEKNFCKDCPVINPNQDGSINKSLEFLLDCGLDKKCETDISVQINAGNYTSKYILGESQEIKLSIDIENLGQEVAYSARALITLPDNTAVTRLDFRCHEIQNQKGIDISCSLGQRLNPGDKINVALIIDVKNLPLSTELLQFIVLVTTTSSDLNPDNDIARLNIPVIKRADLTVLGVTSNEQIRLVKQTKENLENISTAINHIYQVWNNGPSPVESVILEINVPHLPFIIIKSVEPRLEGKSSAFGNCLSDFGTEKNLNLTLSYTESYLTIDCTTASCIKLSCRLGPFLNHEVASVEVLMEVEFEYLHTIIRDKDAIRIVTQSTGIIEKPNVTQSGQRSRNHAQVMTEFIKEGPPTTKAPVPIWVIPVGILLGILILVLVILILFKCGFFNRKKYEKINDEDENEDELGNENQLGSGSESTQSFQYHKGNGI